MLRHCKGGMKNSLQIALQPAWIRCCAVLLQNTSISVVDVPTQRKVGPLIILAYNPLEAPLGSLSRQEVDLLVMSLGNTFFSRPSLEDAVVLTRSVLEFDATTGCDATRAIARSTPKLQSLALIR